MQQKLGNAAMGRNNTLDLRGRRLKQSPTGLQLPPPLDRAAKNPSRAGKRASALSRSNAMPFLSANNRGRTQLARCIKQFFWRQRRLSACSSVSLAPFSSQLFTGEFEGLLPG